MAYHFSNRRALTAACAVVISAFLPVKSRAQDSNARAKILVTSDWLARHLEDRNLVLLHVGEEAEYNKEHLPGARFVRLDDIADSDHETPGGLMLQVPAADKLR